MSKRGDPGLGLVFALLLGAFALSLAPIYLAERRVTPLLSGDWASGRYPTRIYGAPLRLRAGDPMSAGELVERLARLRYQPVSSLPEKPGEYRRRDGVFEVRLRAFSHPFVAATPVLAEIEAADGRVSSARLSGGAPLVEAVLEPELIYEISGERRIRREPLAYHEIPRHMIDALVAVEDRRFFRHNGLDFRGIGRAFVRDVRAGRFAEGASTLTQQLARNLFLSPKRTVWRKLQEALIALYIEARFSKKEILRMYLETVYFGQDGPVSIMGLVSASRHFFDKKPSELTLGESSLLAGMLQSPYQYNPFRNPDRALERRSVVLAAMKREGYITENQRTRALLETLRVTRSGQRPPRPADYFVAYVQRQLLERYGERTLFTRGLTIHTTLDPWLQELAQQAVKRARHQAALVALDPSNGAVRALVGGNDYLLSPFDRATQARRQPGSAFKPFVYGAALRAEGPSGRRWTAASLLSDSARRFRIEGGVWIPKNYDGRYRGTVPLRDALSLSLNAATVNLLSELGPEKVIDYARTLGVESPLRPELGLALGAQEVSLIELTGAYCAFANGGRRTLPYAVDAALDAAGDVVEYRSNERRTALEAGEAYLMTSLLREAVRTGTARSLKEWGLDDRAAGKTGTTDDGKDAWFIGYTPRLAAGVWTGTDLPTGLGISGASAAVPVWADFMAAASPRPPKGVEPWPMPADVSELQVDPSSGMKARSGCPQKRREVFLAGTEPPAECPLHEGGVVGWFKSLFER